ncbi:uncharacterized protein LOC128389484 [Panonychus citri]|uniref:uncharacterized protein LOC128389484 n=1 Tax=Panonychus citri TaxID=50023 RepID=UPI0023074360|nr:uncharacterized protein LOC128389484 [Panonychus citri]
MNLNDLPDDCLLVIFDQFSDLGSFPKLTKVCKRWRDLVQIRLRKVIYLKYIATFSLEMFPVKPKLFGKCILTNDLVLLESIKLSQFLPNVKKIKFFNFHNYDEQCLCSALANLLATGNPITQLIFTIDDQIFSHSCPIIENLSQFIIPYLENIEHLTTNVNLLVENYFQAYGNHNKLKSLGNRLDLTIDLSHVLNFADSMTNIELLFIDSRNSEHLNRISNYNGPIFEKLESLYIYNCTRLCFITRILDFCPNLRNLTLILPLGTEIIQINSDIKNHNLQGLYINPGCSYGYDIIPIVEKFPNVRYLRIDGTLTESQLTKIVELLPHLSVLVFSDSFNDSPIKDDRIKTFCRLKNLSINFFHQLSCPDLENNELHKKFRNSFKRINVNNKVNNFNQ